ncbi:MAG: phosphoribosylglycinamide formyltransferase [Candidatus Omnitrophica bacterium]|nr:phosphoribosylglycinamide formyltransferase [Candidatus Omnitrophota bacterium]MBU1047190.1 phosphoribosylglycinamide formyltransferase [Candidatus Omnitrophota bacterium]MBU1766761.1 phosphoribosylglycinamide formyltransferase [Candidatus Omnitrophota bacterium]MBU1889490.1 phosphoribosylglycinamide formyltransferase [Candidatus Omnitrophota bacterium]
MNKKKLKIAVLGSTRGTNLEAIFNTIQTGELDAEIIAVISDKKNAYILERARSYGLPAFFIDPKDFNKREDYDKNIIEKLKNEKTDLVLLIGYMRILSLCFVEQFKNKIMNIHPSLLPAFAGGMDLDVHKLVIEQEVEITGCTLHFVDEGTDTGPIILQKTVEVNKDDTPQSLKGKVQEAEQKIIVEGIKLFQKGQLKVENGKVKILS